MSDSMTFCVQAVDVDAAMSNVWIGCDVVLIRSSTGAALRLMSLLQPMLASKTAIDATVVIVAMTTDLVLFMFTPYAPRMIRGVMKISNSSGAVEMLCVLKRYPRIGI